MKVIIINNSSDNLGPYANGAITATANSDTNVVQSLWDDLYYDTNAIKDIRTQNISINDGSKNYFGEDAVAYLKSITRQRTVQNVGADTYIPYRISTNFVAAKATILGNTATTFDFKFTLKLAFKGANGFLTTPTLGDFISVQIIDIDNVLGLGANTVIATPIVKWWCNPNGQFNFDNVAFSQLPAAGLYARFIYTAVGLVADVDARINFMTYIGT